MDFMDMISDLLFLAKLCSVLTGPHLMQIQIKYLFKMKKKIEVLPIKHLFVMVIAASMCQLWERERKKKDAFTKIMKNIFLSHFSDLLLYSLSVLKLFKCPGGVLIRVPNLLRSLMKALPSRQAYFSKWQ